MLLTVRELGRTYKDLRAQLEPGTLAILQMDIMNSIPKDYGVFTETSLLSSTGIITAVYLAEFGTCRAFVAATTLAMGWCEQRP